MRYVLYIEKIDNLESHRTQYSAKDFNSHDEAIKKFKKIVQNYLLRNYSQVHCTVAYNGKDIANFTILRAGKPTERVFERL